MKKIISLIIVSGILTLAGAASAQDSLSGEEIAKRAHGVNKSASGIILKGQLSMKNMANGSTESRKAVVMTVTKGGLTQALIRFTDSSYSGTTMLTVERPGKDNLQYLYLPSVGSPRQIEGSDRENNFVDTDFSNEDLGGSRIADYNYKRLADQKAGANDCYVIERLPKSSSSKYSRHVVVIDKATMIPLSVQFYGRSGRVVKTMRAGQIRNIGNNINVPMYLEVVDIEKKRQTTLGVTSAEERALNQGYFNRNRMSAKWAEQ
jgi:outer membrane lipoprotein-sorting protein